eukprot:14283636-Heterocapsa_arctica.AAC.1
MEPAFFRSCTLEHASFSFLSDRHHARCHHRGLAVRKRGGHSHLPLLEGVQQPSGQAVRQTRRSTPTRG